MRLLLALWATLWATFAAAQGYINPPIYATGYIAVQPGTAVRTQVYNAVNPNNLNILAQGNITGWTITLPAPPFDGEIITVGCPGGNVSGLSVVTTDGSTVGAGSPIICAQGNIALYQFNYIANSWMVIYSGNATGGAYVFLRQVCPDSIGILSCSTAMQSAANALGALGGGTLQGNPADFYYLATTVTFPSNVSIVLGVQSAGVPANGVYGLNPTNVFGLGHGPGGTILLNPAATLIFSGSNGIQNGYVINSALPTPATKVAALANIAAYSGTAIQANGSNVRLQNLMIIGFNKGIYLGVLDGRMTVRDVFLDDTNGLEVTVSGDVEHVDHIEGNAWYLANIATRFPDGHPLDLTIRNGYFINVHDVTDKFYCADCFAYGWKLGDTFVNAYLPELVGGGLEFPAAGNGYTPVGTSYGLQTSGNTNLAWENGELSGQTFPMNLAAATGVSGGGGHQFSNMTLGADGSTTNFVVAATGTYGSFTGTHFAGGVGGGFSVVIQAGALAWTFAGNTFDSQSTAQPFSVDITARPFFTDIANQTVNGSQADTLAAQIPYPIVSYQNGSGNVIVARGVNTFVSGGIQSVEYSGSAGPSGTPAGGLEIGTFGNDYLGFRTGSNVKRMELDYTGGSTATLAEAGGQAVTLGSSGARFVGLYSGFIDVGTYTAFPVTSSAQTSNFNITAGRVLTCDATSGNVTATLPAATGTHKQFILKKIDSSANACILAAAGGETIDGLASRSITVQNGSLTVDDASAGVWWTEGLSPAISAAAGASITTVGAFANTLTFQSAGSFIFPNTASGTLTTASITQTLTNKTLTTPRLTTGIFSSLTACASGIEGQLAAVTDSSTATWGATITGSSTNHVLAYCDGTNWTVAGK